MIRYEGKTYMAENSNLNAESQAVQTHVTIMQGVIQRMAGNSRSCKVWCVTIVAAVLVLVARTEKPDHALIALVPALLFFILDTYYLSLEQRYRNSYNEFVETLHNSELSASALYEVKLTGSFWIHTLRSARSFSTWPFYAVLAIMIGIVWLFVVP